jgi:ribose transport system ATP-binding protein
VQVELRHLGRRGVVEDVSFDVRRGEVFGIGGLVGSGRSELVNLIFGADKRDSGEILINGRAVQVNSPYDAVNAGICLITEDRKKLAMFTPRSVTENIAIVHNERYEPPVLNLAAERRQVREMVQRLRIAVSDDESQTIAELSGGNQQKAIIGRWLLSDATLYIFDEPTKGVDVGARAEIFGLIVELAKNGKSIIMVSSDMPELISMSDRIGVMRGGRLTHVLDRQEVTEEMLIKHFIGV